MTNAAFIRAFPVVNNLLEQAILQSKTPNDVRIDMLRIRDIDMDAREDYRGCISLEEYPHAFPIITTHYESAVYVNNIASSFGHPVPFSVIEDYKLLLNIKDRDD